VNWTLLRPLIISMCLALSLGVPAAHAAPWKQLLDSSRALEKSKAFAPAIQIARAALDSAKAQHGESDSSIAMIYHQIGRCFNATNGLDSSLLYFMKAVQAWNIAPHANQSERIKSVQNVGAVYLNQKQYQLALPYLHEALDFKQKQRPIDSLSLSYTLSALAQTYVATDSLPIAELYAIQALDIRRRIFGDTSAQTGLYFNNLGIVYFQTYRWDKAAEMFEKAYPTFRTSSPAGLHFIMGNLAECYARTGQYVRAAALFDSLAPYLDTTNEFNTAASCDLLNNYARCCQHIDSLAKSNALLSFALALAARKAPKNELVRGRISSNIGFNRLREKRYAEAESSFVISIDIFSRNLGPTHPEVASAVSQLAHACRREGQVDRALGLYDSSLTLFWRSYARSVPSLSEWDALKTIAELQRSFSDYASCFFDHPNPTAEQVEKMAGAVLSCKGLLTEIVRERKQKDAEQTDPALAALAVQMNAARKQLSASFVARSTGLDTAQQQHILDSLGRVCAELEASYALKSSSSRDARTLSELDSKPLARLLPPRSVLIEYFQFVLRDSDSSAQPRFGALILEPGRPPVIRDLGNAELLNSAIQTYRTHFLAMAKAGHPPDDNDLIAYRSLAAGVYKLAVLPVSDKLAGKSLVLIAPDGPLNLVSFAGLIDTSGTYLAYGPPIQYLSAGRDLVRLNQSAPHGSGLLALGDPDYDATAEMRFTNSGKSYAALGEQLSPQSDASNNRRSACDILNHLTATPLAETRTELDQAITSWKKQSKEPASAFVGAGATEDCLRERGPGKRVIHLATHGYSSIGGCDLSWKSDSSADRQTVFNENPLLLSGLLFAGANLHGAGADSLRIADGILTADEVTGLNLSGTQLVVLSACETGLGDIRQGEGVYGLRRAFQMAGARTVVSALWSVPDQATAAMMGRLYVSSGKSLAERMREIELNQIEKLRRAGIPDHPYHWAGFVAQGDWR
jgi:CHAT domain-containing protein/tetratricopeptide (TPR) repeat protein